MTLLEKYAKPTPSTESQEDIIKRFGKIQRKGNFLCPRCGLDQMNKRAFWNAQSRRTNLRICTHCQGTEELEDSATTETNKMPVGQWRIMTSPEEFFRKDRDYETFIVTFGDKECFPFQNSYIKIHAFGREDARKKFRDNFPDAHDGVYNYSIMYRLDEWLAEADVYLQTFHRLDEWLDLQTFQGLIRLNGLFEPAKI